MLRPFRGVLLGVLGYAEDNEDDDNDPPRPIIDRVQPSLWSVMHD